MTDDETFAARWARRKQEARKPASATPSASLAEQSQIDETLVGDSADDLPMPTLNDVTPDGDVIAFLHKRIPAELQKLALRKAWETDPIISSFIEVAENQYDWNVPGGCPGYGPLDPSWDVEKLLAQATGSMPVEQEDEMNVETAQLESEGDGDCGSLSHADAEQASEAEQSHAAPQHTVHADDASNDAGLDKKHPAEEISSVRYGLIEAPPIDMAQEAQRVAVQQTGAPRHRRHGGALPAV